MALKDEFVMVDLGNKVLASRPGPQANSVESAGAALTKDQRPFRSVITDSRA